MSLFQPNPQKLLQKRDIEGLIKALGYQKDAKIRLAAAQALGQLGGERAIQALIQALLDTDSGVKNAVTEALVRFGEGASNMLLLALHDQNSSLRIEVASILRNFSNPPAIDLLAVALKDPDKDVRGKAVFSLEHFKDPRAIELLAFALEDTEKDVRRWAAGILIKFKDPRGIPMLVDMLNDPDDQFRISVAASLAKQGNERGFEQLLTDLHHPDEKVRMFAVISFGSVGGPRVIEPLIEALGDPEPAVRLVIVVSLGVVRDVRDLHGSHDDRVTQALTRVAQEDPVPAVRAAAANSLKSSLFSGEAYFGSLS